MISVFQSLEANLKRSGNNHPKFTNRLGSNFSQFYSCKDSRANLQNTSIARLVLHQIVMNVDEKARNDNDECKTIRFCKKHVAHRLLFCMKRQLKCGDWVYIYMQIMKAAQASQRLRYINPSTSDNENDHQLGLHLFNKSNLALVEGSNLHVKPWYPLSRAAKNVVWHFLFFRLHLFVGIMQGTFPIPGD